MRAHRIHIIPGDEQCSKATQSLFQQTSVSADERLEKPFNSELVCTLCAEALFPLPETCNKLIENETCQEKSAKLFMDISSQTDIGGYRYLNIKQHAAMLSTAGVGSVHRSKILKRSFSKKRRPSL